MTEGYEPYKTLWILFHQQGYGGRFVEEDRKEMVSVVDYVHDSDHHPEGPEGSTFVERFMKLMPPGTELDVLNQPLAQGLLECLQPFKAEGDCYKSPELFVRGWDPRGVYDHFKGGVYLLRGLSKWASGEGEPVVEYTSLLHASHHARLVRDWCEVVRWPDGKYRSRFVHRGVDLSVPPPSFKVSSPEIVHVDESSRREAQREPLRPAEGGRDEGGGSRVPF